MSVIARVGGVDEAVALAATLCDAGEYDWFRGQVKNFPVVASFARKSEADGELAREKFERLKRWVENTPGLEELAAAGADPILAVAQHYGLPTQFVDFTTDPAVAGFFASDSDELVPGELSCIICLSTEDIARFWQAMPAGSPSPECLRLEVANLWRLQAQKGVFFFCPFENIEVVYDFDRIVFPAGAVASQAMRDRMYPVHKSQLEILLDQFFMNERMIENSRAMSDAWNLLALESLPERINPKLARTETPVLESWRPEALTAWRSTYDEPLASVAGGTSRLLGIDLTSDPAAIARQVTAEITALAARGDAPRSALIDWQCAAAPATAEMSEPQNALNWLWDGLRALPCTDEDVAIGMGNCAGIATACWRLRGVKRWQRAADAILGPTIDLGFGGPDGSHSRGYAARSSLLRCVRRDIAEWIQPDLREQALANIAILVQAIWAPERLFEFGCLAQLFARQLAPGQVLTRTGSAVFFSPSRLTTLGLP